MFPDCVLHVVKNSYEACCVRIQVQRQRRLVIHMYFCQFAKCFEVLVQGFTGSGCKTYEDTILKAALIPFVLASCRCLGPFAVTLTRGCVDEFLEALLI